LPDPHVRACKTDRYRRLALHDRARRACGLELADRLQRGQFPPPGSQRDRPHHLPALRAGAAAHPPLPAQSGRTRSVADRADPAVAVRRQSDVGISDLTPPVTFQPVPAGLRLRLKVAPKAKRNEIGGWLDEPDGSKALKVAVTAAP